MNNLGRGNENNQDSNRILTRETVGIVLELFTLLTLIVLLTRSAIFGHVGFAISSFLLGTFGYCSYAVLAALIYTGFVLITGKRLAVPRRFAVAVVLLFVFLVCLVHTITADVADIAYGSYGAYLADCYRLGEKSFFQTTGGGVIFGLVVYPVVKLTTSVGGYIIFSLLILGSAYLIYAAKKNSYPERRKKREREEQAARQAVPGFAADTSGIYDWNYTDPNASQPYPGAAPQESSAPQSAAQQPAPAAESPAERSKRLYVLGEDFDFKTRRELRQDARREQAQQRQAAQPAPAPQPLSPYAQGHSILYPERSGGEYSWYNERFGGGSSAPSRPSVKSVAEDAPYSSYTSNRIFDKDSYFNKPNRGAISREQYSNCFRTPSNDPYSEGHERSTPRAEPPRAAAAPAPAAPPAPAEKATPASGNTYSAMYTDAVESNISYSAMPKKIVTDTTKDAAAESAAPRRGEDYYRNDVTPSVAKPEERAAAPEPDVSVSRRRAAPERGENVSLDVRAAARRAGFGDFDRAAEEPSAGAGSAADPAEERPVRAESAAVDVPPAPVPVRESLRPAPVAPAEPASPVRESLRPAPVAPAEPVPPVRESLRPAPVAPAEPASPARESLRPAPVAPAEPASPVRPPRAAMEEEEEEERSGLQPVPSELDTAVNLFDGEPEEPAESAVPEAIERVSRRRSEPEEPLPAAEERSSVRGGDALPARAASAVQSEPRKKHVYARYNAPPIDLLNSYDMQQLDADDADETERNKDIIVETLYNLKIQSEVVQVTRGPAVTRYDIDIPGNIPASRVLGCDTELAMRLHAKDGVNIQPNYESGTISIEVPNQIRDNVGLREVIDTREFSSARPNSLAFGLGKDIEGRVILGDITKMIHLLVAGSTGAGKSVCLNALIISLLCKYSPEDLRIILVDPKQVEFNIYEKLPHLMINEIIYEPSKVINVLNWCINEMERRYTLFKEKTKSIALVRDIDEYNAHLLPEEEKLPKIVVIIDELADLMSAAKKEIEDRIQRLTQKSRAAGIHMVLATQRPSVNVITGVIKTNLPTRIAFKVTSGVDSQTILDTNGAEKLLGKGDMLYKTDVMPFPLRVQGAFLNSEEVQRVVEYVKEHNEAYFDDRVADFVNNRGGGGGEGGDDDSVEAVYIEALRNVVDIGQASISMIQRRCSVGYPKAGKIIEWMENMGYISAFDGAKARKVLLSKEEFESKYGDYGE